MAEVTNVVDRRRWRWMAKPDNVRDAFRQDAWHHTVLFLALGLVWAVILQAALVHGLSRYAEGNVGIMNRVMLGQIDADILISGSSRAMYHYDPRVLEADTKLKSFNIGRNGTKLHEQLHLLQVYLQQNRRPRLLIQNLDITSLVENDEISDPKQYIAWLDHDEIYQPLVKSKWYYTLCRLFPLVGIAYTGGGPAAVMGLLQHGSAELDKLKGYAPQYRTWSEDFDRVKAKNPAGMTWRTDPQKLKTLEQLLDTSRRMGIRVILVYSPDYVETHSFYRNRDETIHTFRMAANKFQVPFWDYSDDPLSRDRRYFYNSQHLNNDGATAFSKSIAKRITVAIAGAPADADPSPAKIVAADRTDK